MTVDLSTNYLGLDLKNPLIVSACPISRDVDRILRLENAGASAVVLYSLFAEQFWVDPLTRTSNENRPSVDSTKLDFGTSIDGYMTLIKMAKKLCSIPIVGSLNVESSGDWLKYAKLMEQSGADALELNVYFVPTTIDETATIVEQKYLDAVEDVRKRIGIPLAVKLGPFFSSLPNMAKRIEDAGADGLVLFNRFLQPDIDIEKLEVAPRLTLSSSDEVRLPLRWIAILRKQLKLSLAASSGVHEPSDFIKLILAGADVACVASSVMRRGPTQLTTLLDGLKEYMVGHGFESVDKMRGFVGQRVGDNTSAFERAGYVQTVTSYRDGTQL